MDEKAKTMLKLLFNKGESICVSDNKFATHSVPLEDAFDDKITLVSPNADIFPRQVKTNNLLFCSINPILGFRKDCNVTAFRSYLIELDVGSIKDQLGTIAHFKMPFSCQVFSGSKSVHTAICLSEDLPDKKNYNFIGDWIFNIVTMADRQCKNESRSIRICGAYREPGKKQRLISLKERVPHEELFKWLNKYEHLKPQPIEKKIIPEGEADFSKLSPWAISMLTKGINFKNGRSNGWYGLAYDLALAGFSEESAIETLSQRFIPEHDFKEKEFLRTIQSAYEKIRGLT
jgi:hypothetical protein